MEQRGGLASLRRRLEAAGYAEPLDGGSAALVERLLDDLWRVQDGVKPAVRANQLSAADQKHKVLAELACVRACVAGCVCVCRVLCIL